MNNLPTQSATVRIAGCLTPIDIALARDLLARRGMAVTQRWDEGASAILICGWNCLETNLRAIGLAEATGLPVVLLTGLAKVRDIRAMSEAGARVVRKPSGILTLAHVLREEIIDANARSLRCA